MTQELLTIETAMNDLEFQLSNVRGWISVQNFESAQIKALYLIKAAMELELALKELVSENTPKPDTP